MNPREKRLAVIVGALLLSVGGLFIVKQAVIDPLDRLRVEIRNARVQYEDNEDRILLARRQSLQAEELTELTFSKDVREAAALSRQRLVELLQRTMLEVRLNPLDNETIDRAAGDVAVGWSITTRGRLENIHDFLFLLQNDPYVNRLENIRITPVARSPEYNLTLRYQTLVMPSAIARPATEPLPFASLEDHRRDEHWQLVSRNIMRPFLARPPPPPPPPPQPEQPQQAQQPPPPPPPPQPTARPEFLLVGIFEHPQGVDISFKNTQTQRVTTMQIGDRLAGGEIVMAELRWRPDPRDENNQRPSRVIVRIDDSYWAIDLSMILRDRYRLTPDRLPEDLRTEPVDAGDEPVES
ncbi:MAG: hypothetical protein JJU36_01055 [Phycisphaeraceae bacterium]|nr:hypothetical protein [Phycisphaeraceae bacterium]